MANKYESCMVLLFTQYNLISSKPRVCVLMVIYKALSCFIGLL